MGCKQSSIKSGVPSGHFAAANSDHLPPVPKDSWYAAPFTEETPMEMTDFHTRVKGQVLFSTAHIPTREQDLSRLAGGEPNTSQNFVLGDVNIYGMGYLHNTALYIEHYWRTRVTHNAASAAKFDRPFYDMLLGIKVFINDRLVPDQVSSRNSLLQCTATLLAHEATTTWLCVPVVLFATGDPEQCYLLSAVEVYRGLALSFAAAAATLHTGFHEVRVEVCYGCRSEMNFCTDFIARGGFELEVREGSVPKVVEFVAKLRAMIARRERELPAATSESGSSGGSSITTLVKNAHMDRSKSCPSCGKPLKYICTVCGAEVCGELTCVWTKVAGYPFGCQTHRAVA